MVWLWRDGQHDDLWFDLHGLRGAIRLEYVRPHSETVGLERDGLENTGSEGKAREKAKEHQQSRREASKKVSATSEKVAGAPVLGCHEFYGRRGCPRSDNEQITLA